MVNQWGKEIRKIGQTRMRAIELIRQTILLTYPSEGKFWKSVQEFGKNILKAYLQLIFLKHFYSLKIII